MTHFFADSFERRTGTPLKVVGGDPRLASLLALLAPSRPSLLLDATPEDAWVTRQNIEEKGAVVVWPTTDTSGAPPPAIRDAFPDLVAGSAARLRAPRAGPAAAVSHRLGHDPPRPQATPTPAQ